MRDFRSGATRVLITTDLLARGIDVYQVSLVINYELPREKATYIENSMDEFSQKTDDLKNSMTEIADSIQTITFAINESVKGIGSAADSTQILVGDMENITGHMNENQQIASDLKKETEVFKKL